MTIKERVLHIAEQKGIQKVAFFNDLDLSYANFKGIQKRSALSSDALVSILQRFPEISPAWLLMGEGEMYREEQKDDKPISKTDTSISEPFHQLVRAQEKTILSLERQIEFLEREIQFLRKA